MSNSEVGHLRFFGIICGLALFVAATSLTRGQISDTQASQARTSTVRSVPSGSRMKFPGLVIEPNVDAVTVRDRTRADHEVPFTLNTRVSTSGAVLRAG